jgi:hypothetical protein
VQRTETEIFYDFNNGKIGFNVDKERFYFIMQARRRGRKKAILLLYSEDVRRYR